MTKKTGVFLAFSLLASSPVLGWGQSDKKRPYDAEEIVTIVGYTGIQSTLNWLRLTDRKCRRRRFVAWQITPNRGAPAFVKPIASTNRTNRTVVTDKRTYMFDLSAGGKAGRHCMC